MPIPVSWMQISPVLPSQLEKTRTEPPSRPYFTAFSARLKKARYSKPSLPVTVGHCSQSISAWICFSSIFGASSAKTSENSFGRDTSVFSNWLCSSQRRIRSSITARSRAVLRSTISSILRQSSPEGASSSRSTWTLACMVARGVLSSWATLAENRFWLAKESLNRSSMTLNERQRVPTSSVSWPTSTRTSRSFSVTAVICLLSSRMGRRVRLAAK